MLGAGDDEVHLAVFKLLDGWVEDQLPIDASDASVGGGGQEGDVADGDGRAGGDAGENVRVVFAVEGQDVEMNLHLVHESLGEQRTKRAVDQTGGEDFLGGGPAFALHEPAGEFTGGGAALAVIHLEREKVDPLARLGANDGGENNRVSILDGDGTVGELGVGTGLDGERAPANLPFNSNGLHEK